MLPRLQRDPGSHQRTESVPVAPGPPGFQRSGARIMIAARRLQRNFADGFIAEAVEDLWEPGMRHADTALEDDSFSSTSSHCVAGGGGMPPHSSRMDELIAFVCSNCGNSVKVDPPRIQ